VHLIKFGGSRTGNCLEIRYCSYTEPLVVVWQ